MPSMYAQTFELARVSACSTGLHLRPQMYCLLTYDGVRFQVRIRAPYHTLGQEEMMESAPGVGGAGVAIGGGLGGRAGAGVGEMRGT